MNAFGFSEKNQKMFIKKLDKKTLDFINFNNTL